MPRPGSLPARHMVPCTNQAEAYCVPYCAHVPAAVQKLATTASPTESVGRRRVGIPVCPITTVYCCVFSFTVAKWNGVFGCDQLKTHSHK